MSKAYDYKEMIQIYVSIPHFDSVHEDFRHYREGIVEKLQTVFGIIPTKNADTIKQLGLENDFRQVDIFSLSVLFDVTVMYLRKMETTGVLGQWLEGDPRRTFDYIRNNKTNTNIDSIAVLVDRLSEQHKSIYDTRYQLLYEIFELINEKISKTITSEDLLKLGFDDTQEPKVQDYYDYF